MKLKNILLIAGAGTLALYLYSNRNQNQNQRTHNQKPQKPVDAPDNKVIFESDEVTEKRDTTKEGVNMDGMNNNGFPKNFTGIMDAV